MMKSLFFYGVLAVASFAHAPHTHVELLPEAHKLTVVRKAVHQ